MTVEESFLRTIRDELDEDTPRLIYADWLAEQEERWRTDRGEFIRLQCDRVRRGLPESHASRCAPHQREQILLQRNWDAWIGPLRWLLGSGSQDAWIRGDYKREAIFKFQRGFIEALSLHASTFLAVAGKLVGITPLRRLELIRAGSLAGQLALCSSLDGIPCLWFSDYFVDPIDSDGIRALVDSPYLGRLGDLGLYRNNIGDAGVMALARTDNLSHLHRLELAHNGISDEGAAALARSPLLSQMRYLGLEGNAITSDGRRVLLTSLYLVPGTILKLDNQAALD